MKTGLQPANRRPTPGTLLGAVAGMISLLLAIGTWADRSLRNDLIIHATDAMQAINRTELDRLPFTPTSNPPLEYTHLSETLREISRGIRLTWSPANRRISLYTLKRSPDGIRFGPESIPAGNPMASTLGMIYQRPPAALPGVFDTATPVVTGPYTDEFSTFVSAFVPVPGPSGDHVAAVLGMDVIATDWWWSLAERAAIPSLIALLGILLWVVLDSAWRGRHAPKPVLRKLLVPLTTLFAAVIGGLGFLLWRQDAQWMSTQIDAMVLEVERDWKMASTQQANSLRMVAASIALDPVVALDLRVNDSSRFQRTWRETLARWQAEFGVTSVELLDSDLRILSQLPDGPLSQDPLGGSVLMEAKKDRRAAHGLELVSDGQIHLRAAHPVVLGNSLVGFVRVSKTAEGLWPSVLTGLGDNVLVLVEKSRLNRGRYEESRKRDRLPSSWETARRFVETYHSNEQLAQEYAAWEATPEANRPTFGETLERTRRNKGWRTGEVLIRDTSGFELARLLFLRDFTPEVAAMERIFAVGASGGMAVLGLLVALLYGLLGKVDASIFAQQALLKESEERYRLLSECGTDVIWLLDARTRRFIYVSPSVQKLRGFSAEEAVQQGLDQVMTPASFKLIIESLEARMRAFEAGDESVRTQANDIVQLRRDGSNVATEVVTTLIADPMRRVIQIQGVTRDISERLRRKEELRRLNRALQARSEIGRLLTQASDETTFLSDACRALVEQTGFRLAWVGYREYDGAKSIQPVARAGKDCGYLDAMRTTWADVPDGQGPAAVCLRTNQPVTINDVSTDPHLGKWLEHADGLGIGSVGAFPLSDGDHAFGTLVTYSSNRGAFDAADIKLLTEMARDLAFGVLTLRTDLARRRSEERMSLAAEAVEDGIIDWELGSRQPYFSRRAIELLDLSIGAIPSRLVDLRELVHPADLPAVDQAIRDHVTDGAPFILECRLRNPGDRQRWVLCRGKVVRGANGNPKRVVGAVTDITPRKEAEQKLLELNRQLDHLVQERTASALDLYNNAPCGYHSVGRDGVIEQINDTELKWLGYQRPEVEGRLRLTDLMSPACANRFIGEFPSFMANGVTQTVEVEMLDRDGRLRNVLMTCAVVRDEAGSFLRTRSTSLDITDRKRLESIVRDREAKFRALFEASMDGIIITDTKGRTLDCNDAALRIFGCPDKAEFLRQGPAGLSPERQADGRTTSAAFQDVTTELIAAGSRRIEWLHRRLDGHVFAAEVSLSVVHVAGEVLLQGIVRDISTRKQAEEALRASEQRFRELIEFAPLPLALADSNGRLELLNRQFGKVLGYSLAETADMETFWRCAATDPAAHNLIRESWERAAARASSSSGHMAPLELVLRGRNGRQHTMMVSGTVMEDLLLVAFLDITEVKEANESLRILSQAVEFSPSMIEITNRAGLIEYVNPAWQEGTGYTAAEAVGQPASLLKSGFHPAEFFTDLWSELLAGRTWRGEFRNRKKNAETYWESAAIAPVRDPGGVITHFVAVKEDITAKRQAEVELRQAKEEADSSNRAKSVFLANMSHEIRTPMNAILGFAQILVRNPDTNPAQRQQLATILRSGEHLLELINEILEMSRIESGRVTLTSQPFDLAAALEDVEHMFRLRADAKQLGFQMARSEPLVASVIGDETKLRQILINLLGNAVKFTPAGGSVEMKVRTETSPGGGLVFSADVTDNGVGIGPDELANLFQPFFQAEAGRKAGGGTGLGLSISRHFARLMGGDITVTSRIGAGTTFRVCVQLLPAVTPQAPRTTRQSRQRRLRLKEGTPPCRILVVDDADENRAVIEDFLSLVGFEIRSAINGLDAISQCAEWHPHVVLMDVQMPIMDGLQATAKIREAHCEGLRIVAISANVFPEDQARALEAGADSFMTKPFRLSELLERICELTGVTLVEDDPEPTPPPAPAALSPVSTPDLGQLASVPVELLIQLREATRRVDYDRALELTSEVGTYDGELAGRIRERIERFEFGAVSEALSVISAQQPPTPSPK